MTCPQVVHKVLLVDDDDSVRAMMSATLEKKGFEVTPAATVTEALKLITGGRFDVLITDLHMPNPGDGFTVVTAMLFRMEKERVAAILQRCSIGVVEN